MDYRNIFNMLYGLDTDSNEFVKIVNDLTKEFKNNKQSIKVTKNGTPVVDIKDGEDVLNKKKKYEAPTCTCTKTSKYENPSTTINTGKETVVVNDTTKPFQLCKSVRVDDNDCFTVARALSNGTRIATSPVVIPFPSLTKDGFPTTGVTESDLFLILLYRYRTNKTIYDLLKKAYLQL